MKKFFLILFVVLVLILSAINVNAYSVNDILNGNQDYLLLGTIKDINGDDITVTVDNTVGNAELPIDTKDIIIDKFEYSYCEEHVPKSFNGPKIGDNLFVSVNYKSGKYTLAGGAYKVDSSEIKNCSVIVYSNMKGEDCLSDAVKISYFIRTNGKITEFKSDNGNIYAISDNEKILIYPLPGNESIKMVDKDGKIISNNDIDDVMPIVPNAPQENKSNNNRRVAALLIIATGALSGVVVFYILHAKKRI